MSDYTTIEEQVEYGLEAIPRDRLISVPLQDLLYVHQVLGELVRFFHQSLHSPDLASVERFLGNRDQGMIHLLFHCYYDKMRDMMPPDVEELWDAGTLDNPKPPYYYEPKKDYP